MAALPTKKPTEFGVLCFQLEDFFFPTLTTGGDLVGRLGQLPSTEMSKRAPEL